MEVLQKDRNAYHKVTICSIKSLYLDYICIFFFGSIFIYTYYCVLLFKNVSFLYVNVYDKCEYFLLQLSDKYDNLEREFNILKVRVQHFLIQSCAILLTQIKKCKNPPSFVLTMCLRLYLFFSVGVVQFHREQAVWCSVRGRGTKQVRSVRNTASHHFSGFLMMAVCDDVHCLESIYTCTCIFIIYVLQDSIKVGTGK